MAWLIILVVWPAPLEPMWVKLPAMSAMRGRMRAMSSGAPPAITVMVPSRAAAGPPDTGASTQPIPVSRLRRAANSRVAAGFCRREIDENLVGPGAVRNALRPEGASFDRRRVQDAHEDDVARRGDG